MSVQVITRDGEPEYAVIPWAQYKAMAQALEAQQAPVAEPKVAMLAELKALREARGMALEDLAKAAGVSPAYLAMFEQGERVPSLPIRRALAQALEIPGFGDAE